MSGMSEQMPGPDLAGRHAGEDPITMADSLSVVHQDLVARGETEIVDWDGLRRLLNETYLLFEKLSSRRNALVELSSNLSEAEKDELGVVQEQLPAVRRRLNDIQVQYNLNSKSWRDYLDEPKAQAPEN